MSEEVLDYMRQAMALAEPQVGRTGQNPAVGCLIVRDGVVIASAATADGGRPHAEEQALAAIREQARGADVYVTLDPCDQRSAGGKSCTDLLIEAGVGRVFIGHVDPHPLAAGAGIKRMEDAGIAVESGFHAPEVRMQNVYYFMKWGR